MKKCYCHTDFYRFDKGKTYEYFYEDTHGKFLSVWVIYNKNGGSDNSGYRFFIKRSREFTNYFDEYFDDLNEIRTKKLKKLKKVK